ncbi:MAG: Hsp70 family protein [Anaerolineae bacterium]|nr:Hsp70 family protein [Anaerolineae bacterium]
MRFGVDFGTTNSAIAYYDGQQLHPIVTDPANDNPDMMPSLIYVDRDFQVTVGAAAASAYLQHETGRPVRWRQREAGEIEITVASVGSSGGDPIEFVQQVSVLVDEAANGRLIQSIKTALFNERYEGTRIFGKFYRVDDLIAIILRRLRQAAERETGERCDQIVLGRPVQFSTNPLIDARAEAILLKAAHLAGFDEVRFELEPVGVAYLYHRRSAARQTVLVFDFGGGTLDLTIAEVGGPQAPVILATGGAPIGGNDLDRRIMAALLPYFGGGDEGALAADMSDKLLAWQTMPELSRPHYMERIHRLKRGGHRQSMRALETLISRNMGFKLFKEIEQVKKQLSENPSSTLEFSFEAIQIQETITRRRFDRMIASDLAAIRASVHGLLQSAAVHPDQIDVVLRTGGSSLIPAVRQLLEEIFSQDRVQTIDPLISVTGGFAVVAHGLNPQAAQTSPGELITEVDPSTANLHIIGVGTAVYSDRAFIISRIPSRLHGLPALQTTHTSLTARDDAALQFCLNHPARIYVAYESATARIPYWLRGFDIENLRIEIEDEFALIRRAMQVYSKRFEPGTVILGGNQAEGFEGQVMVNYFVIVQPEDQVA